MGMRPRIETEEMFNGGAWPIDETGHYLRTPSGVNPGLTSQLDLYQHQQRQIPGEQLSTLERNLSLHDRLQRGLNDTNSAPFERSMSLPGVNAEMNVNMIDAIARAQNLNMHESAPRMHTVNQIVSSMNPRHCPPIPNQFNKAHLDSAEVHWSDINSRIHNNALDFQMQGSQTYMDPSKNEAEFQSNHGTPDSWMSDSVDDKSKQLLFELLNRKGQKQANKGQSSDLPYGNRAPSAPLPVSRSSDDTGNDRSKQLLLESLAPKSSPKVSASTTGGLLYDKTNPILASRLLDAPVGTISIQEAGLKMMLSQGSASLSATDQSKLRESESSREISGRKVGQMDEIVSKGVVSGTVQARPLSRNSSGGYQSLDHAGPTGGMSISGTESRGLYSKEIASDRVVLSKDPENVMLRRPPFSRASSSHEELSVLGISDQPVIGKASVSTSTQGGNPALDARYRRTFSCSDADISETSFIDMLKSNAKKPTIPDASTVADSSDAALGSRGGKKKGKKGRQIDPALLGFKVTSNRILMGEIQRADD